MARGNASYLSLAIVYQRLGARTFLNCTPLASSSWSPSLGAFEKSVEANLDIISFLMIEYISFTDRKVSSDFSWSMHKSIDTGGTAIFTFARRAGQSRAAGKKGLVINITSRLEAGCLASEKRKNH